MNEQYSVSWLRGGFRNPDHSEEPITGPVWISRQLGISICVMYSCIYRYVHTHTHIILYICEETETVSETDKYIIESSPQSKHRSKIHRIYFK